MIPISYLVELRDSYSAAAERIARSAQQAMKNVQGMGQAVNAAEKAVAAAGGSMTAAAGSIKGLVSGGAAGARAFSGIAVEADRAAAASYRAAAAMRTAARDAAWSAKGFARGPGGDWNRVGDAPGGVMAVPGRHGSSGWNRLWHAWFGVELARMGVHAVDAAVTHSRAGDVEAMLEKLRFALGPNSEALVQGSYDEAFRLSGVYKNTTVLENLKILDDLRANLPEKFEHFLDPKEGLFAPFVRLHGFFKAWEGGAHAHTGEKVLQDISAAIRAGELLGNMTAKGLAEHADALASARVVFGHKFKVQEYFQATQKAAVALSSSDKTFKYVDFPVLVQRLAQGGGVSLATSFQKLIGGTRVTQGTAEAWRDLGLVDMRKVVLDKKGMIRTGFLTGRKWLKDSDAFGINLTEALMTIVLPALESRGKVPGLKGAAMATAWKAGDIDGLVHLIDEFRKDPVNLLGLNRQLTSLGYDRNATKAWEDLILGSGSILRDRERMLTIRRDFENYASYIAAKQELSAQFNRLWLAITGKDFAGITGAVKGLASAIGWLATAAKNNPLLADALRWTLMAAGVLAVAAAFGAFLRVLRLMAGLTGIPWMLATFVRGPLVGLAQGFASAGIGAAFGASVARIGLLRTALFALMRVSLIGTGIGLGLLAYQFWDQIAAAAEKFGFKIGDLTQQFIDLKNAVAGVFSGNFGDIGRWLAGKEQGKPTDWGLLGKLWDWVRPSDAHAGDGRHMSMRESEIASLDALRQMLSGGAIRLEPRPLEVRYVGPISGPDSIPFGASNHPRGTAAPDYPMYP